MKKFFVAALAVVAACAVQASIHVQSVFEEALNAIPGAHGTSSYVNVSAEVGDVVVLAAATNKKGTATPLLAEQTGGDGATDSAIALSNELACYPTCWVWAFPVTAAGTFEFSIRTGSSSGMAAATTLHVLRADSGRIELAGSATLNDNDKADNGINYSLNYALNAVVENAVLIEAVGVRTDFIQAPAEYRMYPTTASRRAVFSYEAVNGSSWSSDYVFSGGILNLQTSGAAGMIFAEVSAGNRAPVFREDPIVAPVAITNTLFTLNLSSYAADADGDPLRFELLSGPAWLAMVSDDTVSGTAPALEGTNSWVVGVDDGLGGTNSAILQVEIISGGASEIAPDHPYLVYGGSEYVSFDDAGAHFQRHSDALLAVGNSKGFNSEKAKTTTGMSIWFRTDSASVDLEFSIDTSGAVENRGSVFAVYENGILSATHSFNSSTADLGFSILSGSPGVASVFQVVLPNWSKPDFHGMVLGAGSALLPYQPPLRKKYAVIGDSISHGTKQSATHLTYPWIVADRLQYDLYNLAVGGSKVSVPLGEMMAELPSFDVISILIGYNDLHSGNRTMDEFRADYSAMLDATRASQPGATLFCISPTYTPATVNASTGATVDEFRQVVYDAVAARQAAGDEKLFLIRGEEITTAANLADDVHFSEPGAALFAQNLVAEMEPILNTPPPSPQEGPNVLYIAVDDMKPLLGCYGDQRAITPHIDSLAARGVTFMNAQCQWAVCGPSRASVSLGLYPEESGVMGFKKMRGNAAASNRQNGQVRPNVVTLQQHFRYNGFRTAATGKINDPRCVGSMDPVSGLVAEDGRDVDDPASWGDPVNSADLPADFFSNSSYVPSPGGWSPDGKPVTASTNLPDSSFVDGGICDQGITLLQNLATNDTRFFLSVGFKKPHLPFVMPQTYWDLYETSDFSVHPFQNHPKNEVPHSWAYAAELAGYDEFTTGGASVTNIPEDLQLQMIHGYYACASFIDAQVGRLLNELEALGLHTNTIVVLWGDHGFHLGDHAEWAKHTNLEQAARSPLIIYSPFAGVAGAKTQSPAAFVDIYPTLCDLAGLPIPQQPLHENEPATSAAVGRRLKGESLLPVMQDPSASVRGGALTLFKRNSVMGYAYRTERYRYIEWISGSFDTVLDRELYDYSLDPLETVNLAGEPGFDGLMHQYAVAMRSELNAAALSSNDVACAILQRSPELTTTNYTLAGLTLEADAGRVEIGWPEASGWSYNVLVKTNLTDSAWAIEQGPVPGSSITLPADKPAAFYRIDLAP